MSNEVESKLQERKKSLEEEFTKLGEQREKLTEQGKDISRKLNEVAVRQEQLRGAFQEVENLLKSEEPTKEEPKQ